MSRLRPSPEARETRTADDPPVVPPPLAVYVHLPWCVRKCPYCDFNSHAVDGRVDLDAYADALVVDLARETRHVGGRQPVSVFFGGGTPSLFEPAQIGRVLDAIDRHLGLGDDAEITLEANPGTVDAGRFAGYRAAGVNRLSIGVQSLDDRQLVTLGRIHAARDAIAAVAVARDSGFDNINVDLMFGLPGQSVAAALDDLGAALDLGPGHLSWYQLTLEPNTAFFHRPPAGLPDDDRAGDITDAGQALLQAHGFVQYEVSAYAGAGGACRHNRNYWEFGDYLGIGAGAHGKVTRGDGVIERRSKQRSPLRYMADVGTGALSGLRQIAAGELPLEFMLNALRLNAGVPSAYFAQRTGCALSRIDGELRVARARGLMQTSPDRLAPTPLGHSFLNDLLGLFEP